MRPLCCLFLLLLAAPAVAQPTADPADVATPDALLAAVYDVISGPAGEARDWDRFRSLFIEDARLMATGRRPDGGMGLRVMTPEEYITNSGPWLVENGFFETEIARTTERYGSVLHAFSTYESRRTEADPAPFMRGINSFQLWFDGTRWWVVTIYWQGETDDNPIPAEYGG